jgi:DNA-binding Lrp family transcriptional regulator
MSLFKSLKVNYIKEIITAHALTFLCESSRIDPMIKKQDIVLLAKLLCSADGESTYAGLGRALRISPSEIHAASRRLREAKLLSPDGRPVRSSALEFLLHGFKYVFPAEFRPRLTRGIPTAHAAPVAAGAFSENDELVPVWPSPAGDRKGLGIEPLYSTVVEIVEADPALYGFLALLDMLRMGKAREVAWAKQRITELIRRLTPETSATRSTASSRRRTSPCPEKS